MTSPRKILSVVSLFLVQKMIQPTPERLFALFLLYNLSVTHIRVPPFIPAAIQVVSIFDCYVASIPSHIQFLPHLAMISLKDVRSDEIVGSGGPSCSLFTLFLESRMTGVGTPCGYVDRDFSSRVNW
jgi:hypothetical protein